MSACGCQVRSPHCPNCNVENGADRKKVLNSQQMSGCPPIGLEMARTSWCMRLLPDRIFCRYFAKVVFPVQVAPLKKEKVVDRYVLYNQCERAPYTNDDYPLLDHRSAKILSGRDGIESVGNDKEDPGRRNPGIGRTLFVKTITAATCTSKHLSSGPCSPHTLHSPAHRRLITGFTNYEVCHRCRV
jgi:hypothetical protein